MIAHTLQQSGANVIQAGIAPKCYVNSSRLRPHLLLTDVGMPDAVRIPGTCKQTGSNCRNCVQLSQTCSTGAAGNPGRLSRHVSLSYFFFARSIFPSSR